MKPEPCPLNDQKKHLTPVNRCQALCFVLHDLLKNCNAASMLCSAPDDDSPPDEEPFSKALEMVEMHIKEYRLGYDARKRARIAADHAARREVARQSPPPPCPECQAARVWESVPGNDGLNARCELCGVVTSWDNGLPERKPCGCPPNYFCSVCRVETVKVAGARLASIPADPPRRRRRTGGGTTFPDTPEEEPAGDWRKRMDAVKGLIPPGTELSRADAKACVFGEALPGDRFGEPVRGQFVKEARFRTVTYKPGVLVWILSIIARGSFLSFYCVTAEGAHAGHTFNIEADAIAFMENAETLEPLEPPGTLAIAGKGALGKYE